MAEEILHTSTTNIGNWETGRSGIAVRFRPAVFNFLGYFPCDNSLPLGARIKQRRENFGMTVKQLASIFVIAPCTIASWERGDHQVSQKNRALIERFLKEFAPEKPFGTPRKRTKNRKGSKQFLMPNFVRYDARWKTAKKMITWRMSAGLSQRELVLMSGYSFQSINRWETGKRIPTAEILQTIKEAITRHISNS